MPVPSQYVSRACIALQVGQGNHQVSGTDGPVRKSDAIVCLHAPLRARYALAIGKVDQGRRVEEVNHYLQQAWHVRRWRRLADEDAIDAEWAANSYREDCLDVYGERHPLAIDTTLRDVVTPWIDAAAEQDVGRLFRLREASREGVNLRLRQQERGISFLMGQLAARDRVIHERDEGIEWLRRVVRDKEMTIAELEKGVAWLRKEIEAREALIEALRQACAQ